MGVSDSIFFILSNNKEAQDYWVKICILHNITKKYLLLTEEICETGQLFLQPLKEHRDAYDHIIRTFLFDIKQLPENFNRQDYVLKNLNKAYGHEYRAFFDTADWLTYNLRQIIRIRIESMNTTGRVLYNRTAKNKIHKSLKEIVNLLNMYPYEIAKQRYNKDVNLINSVNIINLYKKLMDTLYEIYKITPF